MAVKVRARTLLFRVACLLGLLACVDASAIDIDNTRSQVGFSLKTRWGQTLYGRFPRYTGTVELLPDGRRRTRLTLSARDIEIVGHPTYTGMTRGEGFFEAERFPEVTFVSDPYTIELVHNGGKLGGVLTIRGRPRHKVFTIEPAACDAPGHDCDVVAAGIVRRTDYGVDRWIFAVSDHVRFQLRMRFREEAP